MINMIMIHIAVYKIHLDYSFVFDHWEVVRESPFPETPLQIHPIGFRLGIIQDHRSRNPSRSGWQ